MGGNRGREPWEGTVGGIRRKEPWKELVVGTLAVGPWFLFYKMDFTIWIKVVTLIYFLF